MGVGEVFVAPVGWEVQKTNVLLALRPVNIFIYARVFTDGVMRLSGGLNFLLATHNGIRLKINAV